MPDTPEHQHKSFRERDACSSCRAAMAAARSPTMTDTPELTVDRLAKVIHDDRCVDPSKHSAEAHAGGDPDTREEAARMLRLVSRALRLEPHDA